MRFIARRVAHLRHAALTQCCDHWGNYVGRDQCTCLKNNGLHMREMSGHATTWMQAFHQGLYVAVMAHAQQTMTDAPCPRALGVGLLYVEL